jgi:hypothetical protein
MPEPEKPRPDLNGQRLLSPGDSTVWFIDEGYRRGVPPEAYKNLFKDKPKPITDINTHELPQRPDIYKHAALVRGSDRTVYLIDSEVKRAITSIAFDKCCFRPDCVKTVPDIVLSFIANGPPINWT